MSEVLNLNLSNVVNVAVLTTPSGAALPNVNTIALFSSETPVNQSLGDYGIYKDTASVLDDWGAESNAYAIAVAVFSQNPNILIGGGYLVIVPRESGTEKVHTAIARVQDMVYFFGVLVDEDLVASSDFVDLTDSIQALDKILVFCSKTAGDITPTSGRFDVCRDSGNTHSRLIYYTMTGGVNPDAFVVAAAYAGRLISTNFSGSNTCQTMNLKQLATIPVDTGLTQVSVAAAIAAGADTYPSIGGLPCVMSSGENSFSDQVYNSLWLKLAIQTVGFNYLKQTNTKIPQTESGMEGLKNAYRKVMALAVTNGYLAPGSWTSADTFGDLESFYRNITDIGYYIYSQPISQQIAADREDRIAPIIQIAGKEAGAIHSTSIIININA
jgi:hypothetical protein